MSILGNYVHYYTANYIQYGARRAGTPAAETYAMARAIAENKYQEYLGALTPVSDKTLAELRSFYSRNSLSQVDKDFTQLDEIMQHNLFIANKLIAERTTMSLYGMLQGSTFKKTGGDGLTIPTEGDRSYRAIVGDNVNSPAYKRFRDSHNPSSIKQKMANLQRLKADLEALDGCRVSEQQMKSIMTRYKNIMGYAFEGNPVSDFAILQDLVNNAVFYTDQGNLIGAYGEWIGALAAAQSKKLSMQEMDKLIANVVKGRDRSQIVVDKKITDNIINPTAFLSSRQNNNKQLRHELNVTQNKIDLKMMINNEDVYASVKNYSNISTKKNNKLSLQSQIGLTETLTFLGNDFGTHWLNMHAYAGNAKIASIDQGDADQMVTKMMAYQALASGNLMKTGATAANTFIAFDRIQGKVIVESTADMLNRHLNLFHVTANGGNVSAYRIPNIWVREHDGMSREDAIQARLNKFMADVHQANFNVALTAQTLFR